MGNSHKNLLLRNHWANCNQLLWNDPWMAPFQNCVQWSWLATKMAAKLKIEKRAMDKQNLLLWNYWANVNETLLKWSLGGPQLSSAVGPSWSKGRTAGHIFGREPSNDYFNKILFLSSKWFQTRRFLWEFPIGSYVKLSSAVAAGVFAFFSLFFFLF
jgi:hypothetical protein